MAFSIDWFLTVPGILITVGVILLIIALIMFVVSSMKEKKGDAAPSVLENKETSTVTEVQDNVVLETQNNVNLESQPVIEEPVFTMNNNIENNVEPAVSQVDIPLIDAVSEEVIVPSFEGDNVIPVVNENHNNGLDNQNILKENTFIPVDFEEVIVPSEKLNNTEVIPTETIAVENSFEIPEPIISNEPRPIYGGADPLEATQTLPRMDVHHEPYSGGTKEVNIIPEVENVIEPVFEINEEPVKPEVVPQQVQIEEPVNIPEGIPSIISIPDEEEIEEL